MVYNLASHRFLTQITRLHSILCVGLKSNQKVVGNCRNIFVSFATVCRPCWACGYRSQGSQLGKATYDFSSMVTCVKPSCTIKSMQEGQSFLVRTSSISPYPVIQMCDVFSNKVLHYENGHFTKKV